MHNTILLHNSHWANNIGNSFFTLGVKYILENTFEDSKVIQTDQLSTLAWHQPRFLIEKNDLKYPSYSEPDWFVLSGPMFQKKPMNKLIPVFERVFSNNDKTKLIIMNAGSIGYDKEEVKYCRSVLKKYNPYLFTTRDEFTYEHYADLAENSYNGFDTAFFCSDYFTKYETPKLGDYCTFTFDKIVEPKINLNGFDEEDKNTWNNLTINHRLKLPFRINKYFDLIRNFPQESAGRKIVRPTHKIQGNNSIELFRLPNSFVSQTPFGYLNLYANTDLTISDRVHACIPTLAFGNAAMLISSTKRKALFSRLNLDDINGNIIKIDQSYLKEEKDKYLDYMKNLSI
ncbi:polysaccharide pyruvyl transferase family protein [Fodinibius sp. Rm-B-1B1-1]|uniref:polysaccharide pyruvyl transferase family protein n=1 Tax=Fodinibius alkaliphilus TaxID=3140241 RepID=UPI00315B2098